MTEFLKNIWIAIFGTTEAMGLNIGFWMSMLAVVVLVIIMVAVFWSFSPKDDAQDEPAALKHEDVTLSPTDGEEKK